ncbi:uncharacterized protein LOC126742390 isoform X2 [Anthonomus grandis grandis]|uniref:uncharacterized protein LOC126742390 isoform X2 n=1 Tax=Anthonomus grandis grandis TaxID=2921223 RepID=UPI002166B814|nr:uncharacterized protein LOC126742390 isoform X2 [Anthonomus grandis grandis]
MECPPPKMDRVHIDITTYPTAPPPPPPVEQPIPPKLLAIMAKYPQNWRLEQLSKPRRLVKKYVPLPTDYVKPMKKRPSLNDEIKFYSDQNSRPRVRDLYINRALYSKFTKGLRKKFNKNITKAWGSIYNYYKNKERLRKLRELRRKQKDKKGKKRVLDPAKYEALAKPKPVFYPEPKKKPQKYSTTTDIWMNWLLPNPATQNLQKVSRKRAQISKDTSEVPKRSASIGTWKSHKGCLEIQNYTENRGVSAAETAQRKVERR